MYVRLREIKCRWCHKLFYLCRPCDHGRRYCCDECLEYGTQRRVGNARSTYAGSEKGQINNRERQARHRRYKALSSAAKETVTDRSSHKALDQVPWGHEKEQTKLPAPQSSRQTQAVTGRSPQEERCIHGLVKVPESCPPPPPVGIPPGAALQRCSCCGRWGWVVRSTASYGRFRRLLAGRFTDP